MRTLALAAAGMLAATACLAQGTTTATPASPQGAAPAERAAPDTTGTTAAPDLKPGANSFTESQARGRIEANGFTQIKGLAKDDNGIWRGQAMKDGKATSVAVDFKGNVSMN